jgi:hypothetical protein
MGLPISRTALDRLGERLTQGANEDDMVLLEPEPGSGLTYEQRVRLVGLLQIELSDALAMLEEQLEATAVDLERLVDITDSDESRMELAARKDDQTEMRRGMTTVRETVGRLLNTLLRGIEQGGLE